MKSFISGLSLIATLALPISGQANDSWTELQAQVKEIQQGTHSTPPVVFDQEALNSLRDNTWKEKRELLLRRGGSDAGGGNSVGDELFDDYENQGSLVISPNQLEKMAAPYLTIVDQKLPEFGKKLRRGLTGVTWYLEPKPLAQEGGCVNQSQLSVNLVVRACQSRISVRIDKDFFEKNPSVAAPLVLHELLVFLKIQEGSVNEEGLREVSRQMRNTSVDEQTLQRSVERAGFGLYRTGSEHKVAQTRLASYKNFHMKAATEYCAGRIKNAVKFQKAAAAVLNLEGGGPYKDDQVLKAYGEALDQLSRKMNSCYTK